ncbi:MAG: NAD(P)H-hydrate dehydratase [Acidimicrobiales bacterium]
MIPVLSKEQMRAVDARILASGTLESVIDNVGRSIAREIARFLGTCYGRRIVIECGPGNNGNDGRAAARHLRARGAHVTEVDAGEPINQSVLAEADLYVDAIVGIGVTRGREARSLPLGLPVVAVDLPSGVHPDTGAAFGDPIPADLTLAVGGLKRGHLQNAGAQLCGRLEIVMPELAPTDGEVWMIQDADVLAAVPQGGLETHKWKRGVMVVAGSPELPGAGAIAACAAYRLSGGIVHLFSQGRNADLVGASSVPIPPELVVRALESLWAEPMVAESARFRSLVVGPGVGRGMQIANFLRRLVANTETPTVVDADALYAFGSPERLERTARRNKSGIVITPHEGEFRALFEPSGLTLDSSADRIEVAVEAARRSGCVVLLKGSPTVVASPEGWVRIIVSGSAALSFAGSGDVLSGVIGGLLARGLAPFEAASIGAHLHGRATIDQPRYSWTPEALTEAIDTWLSRTRGDWHVPHPARSLATLANVPLRAN